MTSFPGGKKIVSLIPGVKNLIKSMIEKKQYTIVLDPGHGLNKEGKYSRPLIDCRSGKAIIINDFRPHPLDGVDGVYREDFGTLALAKVTKAYLESLGHTVFLTRETDQNVEHNLPDELGANEWKKRMWKPHQWIGEFVRQKNPDIFISIHTNAGGGAGSCGFFHDPGSRDFAQAVCDEIKAQIGLPIRRIEKRDFAVLRNSAKCKSILLEALFHDRYEDVKILLQPDGYDRVGSAIGAGIENYLSSMSP